jgi:hypothetical protein
VWMAPVTALVMITLRACDMTGFSPVVVGAVPAGPAASAGQAPP